MNKLSFVIILILLYTSDCLSQVNRFYVVDTVTISNPVVFYKPNQSGRFISNLKTINNQCNIKKIVSNENVYIYGQDFYRFIEDTSQMKSYHYPDYGNCTFKRDYFKIGRSLVYREFEKEPEKFVIALINTAYYDKKIASYGDERSIFRTYGESLYYKIAFPLCKD